MFEICCDRSDSMVAGMRQSDTGLGQPARKLLSSSDRYVPCWSYVKRLAADSRALAVKRDRSERTAGRTQKMLLAVDDGASKRGAIADVLRDACLAA